MSTNGPSTALESARHFHSSWQQQRFNEPRRMSEHSSTHPHPSASLVGTTRTCEECLPVYCMHMSHNESTWIHMKDCECMCTMNLYGWENMLWPLLNRCQILASRSNIKHFPSFSKIDSKWFGMIKHAEGSSQVIQVCRQAAGLGWQRSSYPSWWSGHCTHHLLRPGMASERERMADVCAEVPRWLQEVSSHPPWPCPASQDSAQSIARTKRVRLPGTADPTEALQSGCV